MDSARKLLKELCAFAPLREIVLYTIDNIQFQNCSARRIISNEKI